MATTPLLADPAKQALLVARLPHASGCFLTDIVTEKDTVKRFTTSKGQHMRTVMYALAHHLQEKRTQQRTLALCLYRLNTLPPEMRYMIMDWTRCKKYTQLWKTSPLHHLGQPPISPSQIITASIHYWSDNDANKKHAFLWVAQELFHWIHNNVFKEQLLQTLCRLCSSSHMIQHQECMFAQAAYWLTQSCQHTNSNFIEACIRLALDDKPFVFPEQRTLIRALAQSTFSHPKDSSWLCTFLLTNLE